MPGSGAAIAGGQGKGSQAVQRIILVVLENQDADDVMQDERFRTLASRGALFTRSYGVAHPSYPNYLALVGHHVELQDWSDKQKTRHEMSIANKLEAKGLSWKSYVEAYPPTDRQPTGEQKCGTVVVDGRYARRHVPLLSYAFVQQERCDYIVDATEFERDVAGRFPHFAFYTPDLCHDGHGAPACGFGVFEDEKRLDAAARWLSNFLGRLEHPEANPYFMDGTLIIVTFDESDNHIPLREAKQVYTLFLGPMVRPGSYNEEIDHYDVRRTIEEQLGIEPVGSWGRPITSLWK
jgi:acid phosphatase